MPSASCCCSNKFCKIGGLFSFSSVERGLTWAHGVNFKVLGRLFLQETLGGSASPCLFQLQRSPAFHGLWPFLHVHIQPRSIFKPLSTSQPSITFASLTLQPPSFLYKNPCGYIGPSWIIQDKLPISKSLTLSHSQKLFGHIR